MDKSKVNIKSRQMPALNCPHCNSVIDACTGVSTLDDPPIPCEGDITVCFYCGTVLKFQDRQLVAATEVEWLEVDPFLRRAIAAVAKQPIRFEG